MTIKTAIFKIHNLSNHKRSVMDYTFKQYTLAYDYLLKLAKDKVDQIQTECIYRDKISVRTLASYLAKSSYNLPHYPIHSSLKESLFTNVAENIASYIELKKDDAKTSYPTSRQLKHRKDTYIKALQGLANSIELDEEKYYRDQLTQVNRGQYMPMFFGRPNGIVGNRNFGLVYNKVQDKYYATLFLLARDSKRSQIIVSKNNLTAINSNPKGLTSTKRKMPYIIVPLAFGAWQKDNYLRYALEHPKSIRTAILRKKDSNYFLHVSFKFEVEKRETRTYLGIDRGITKLIALSLVDDHGNCIYQKDFSGKEYDTYQEKMARMLKIDQKQGKIKLKRYSNINEAYIHSLANQVIQLADQYDSQVVFENLKYLAKGGFKKKTGNKKLDRIMNRKLGRNPYNKLKQILDYKLPNIGLPQPKLVPGAYTSLACSKCNNIDKANRPNQAEFKCTKCGYEAMPTITLPSISQGEVSSGWLGP